ncbi:hypothetical protein BV25DRAFT_1800527 [Artomyces pyxidatus]|uniref:Uncharacterized protein n=1 Tax=Artomyces pyxidatus TaxID=48021 RepID=A0ACB8T6X4_9AGAM|nr:hypothetical protein BV25DRAFT_1800527 [Artomyces pyxidatus]
MKNGPSFASHYTTVPDTISAVQQVSRLTSTLDLTFESDDGDHIYRLTNYCRNPITAVARLDAPLVGNCPSARFLFPRVPTSPGAKRNTFSASLTFSGPHGDWPARACIKYASGKEEVDRLVAEARFYLFELRNLQGVAVPTFYGLFEGRVDGRPIACMVLELCTGRDAICKYADEFNRLVMVAVCKIHGEGVLHGNLHDYRHFVMKGKQVFVVDFSMAIRHKCEGGTPALQWDGLVNDAPTGCIELYIAERKFGLGLGM